MKAVAIGTKVLNALLTHTTMLAKKTWRQGIVRVRRCIPARPVGVVTNDMAAYRGIGPPFL